MTKVDLIDKLCEKFGLSRKDALRLTNQFFDMIKDTLKNGENVKISGFGTFSARRKNSRRGRNPRDGKPLTITERTVLVFKPSQMLKESLNPERK